MGVKGLQYFVEKHYTDVCQTVSIEQLADEHKRLHPGMEAVLVVDGMSLLHRLYAKTLEWLYGGQWLQFLAVLKGFVSRFQNIGVKLVFFFDGSVMPQKRHEWVERRLKKVRDIDRMFMFMKRTQQEPHVDDFKLPASAGTITRFALKYSVGVEVYSTTREADLEIADYARKQQAVFAILGQDSDFIIYDSKPYLSASHLDLERMTTFLYDRRILASRLSLSVSKLPLFSCLLGNDIIPLEMVKPFHHWLCHSAGKRSTGVAVVAPLVSNLINRNRWRGDIYDHQEMAAISSIVLGDARNCDLLRDGLKWYSLSVPSPPQPQDIVQKRHIVCENVPAVYNVFRNLEYESSQLLEDPTELPPASEIYKPMRQRAYGILFSGRPDVLVKEWCAYLGNEMSAPDLVAPLPIRSVTNCTMAELWSSSPEFHSERIQHFVRCLDVPLQPQQLYCIPEKYVILVCILNYLLTYSPPFLRLSEVVAFVVQAVSLKAKDLNSLYALKIQGVEPRAIQLASLFMRGVATVGLVLGICGYPFPLTSAMPWNFFDGKLFHDAYIRSKSGLEIESLCESQDEIEEVHKLLSVVTYGSHLANRQLIHASH